MKNQRVINCLLGMVFLVIVVVFLYLSTFIKPKIIFSPQINKINGEDYKRIVNLHIKIITPLELINHVNIENLPPNGLIIQQYLQNNNEVKVLSGGGAYGVNSKEFQEQVELSLKNISDDE